ncbi:hypothetical protein JCM11251_005773 [Rhodosporidiobolus azoricus]
MPSTGTAVSLVEGAWQRTTSLAYGIACSAFLPLTKDEANLNRTTVDREQLNPHQVPLEVGDEVYVVEVFRPFDSDTSADDDEGVWYRGYVVSSSPRPRLPSASDLSSLPSSSSGPALSDEPEVSLGIFPAAAVTIREHLAEELVEEQAEAQPTSRAPSRGPSRGATARMDPLQEEDEDEAGEDNFRNMDGSPRKQEPVSIGPPSSPSKARNRISVGSMKALQASRLSAQPSSRPPPPLPSLKAGDETRAGLEEPLVDEISCALREWAALLYSHLYKREYGLFELVQEHFNSLHGQRKQLLAKALSVEETDRLRREAVTKLVEGNLAQGLDVIVRHPISGALVDVNVEGELDRKAWMTVVRMYAMQVALAYGAPVPDHGLSLSPPPVHTPNPNFSYSPLLTSNPNPQGGSGPSPPKFYHVFLDVRALVANIAGQGEFVELYFSLFSKTDSRYVTEEYCLVLNHNGAPARESEGRFGRMRTLFRDLSQHDVQGPLFLVCRIVKNGSIKLSGSISHSTSATPPLAASRSGFLAAPPSARSDADSFDSSLSRPQTSDNSHDGPAGMLWTDSSGRESFRRPFGCAVLEVSQFNKHAAEGSLSNAPLDQLEEHQMPIFVPVNESAISTLHEDIINSRISAIEKSPRAEQLAVSVHILHGAASEVMRESPLQLSGIPFTSRLSFPDVVWPGDERNEMYVKLWSGDFGGVGSGGGGGTATVRSLAQLAAAGSGAQVEVTVELRTREGATMEKALSRGAGEAKVTRFTSIVFQSNNAPTWGELMKISAEQNAHLFFSFRNRNSRSGLDPPFAFAYFPLCPEGNSAFQPDGSHTLVLYKYDRTVATPPFYFQVPSVYDSSRQLAPLAPSVSRTLIPLKDSFVIIRSFLVSSTFTQNQTLLRLLRWEQELLSDPELMKDTLAKLRFCSEIEVCKFLRDVLNALFAILVSTANQQGELDDLVFQALVVIFGFASDSDRRFNREGRARLLDLYIAQHFTGSTAAAQIIQSLQRLLRSPGDSESATTLRSSIKVWRWFIKLLVRSREIQRTKSLGSGVSDHLDATFKNDLLALFNQINPLMRTSTPSSIIGTQTLVVQHFASILPEMSSAFSLDELTDIAISFADAIPATKGKMVIHKLVFLNQLVKSTIFASPTTRATLVPNLVRWLKPSLGKFDEHAMCSPKDPQTTRDQTRVGWVEANRLAVGVVAAVLDAVQVALIDPDLNANRALVAQEHDNIEYLLSLLPILAASFLELQNLANLDAIERQRTPASIPATVPVVFPSSYPVSLLSYPAEYSRRRSSPLGERSLGGREDKEMWPTLRASVGEVACVLLALVHLTPRKFLANWLESTLEIEGDNFSRQLGQVFRVLRGILEHEAFPADWLNMSAFAHRVILKLADPVADILMREYVPPPQASFKFNTGLWRDFFAMLLKLLASPQMTIEEFPPQRQRSVWRLAGDVRGEGADILARTWGAIAAPEQRKPVPYGLYQVQFIPSLTESVLSLCLSHHDELRRVAVNMLYSMIVSEYTLNKHFGDLEAAIIGSLDKLFGVQTKGDEISRAFFVAQLRQLFDDSHTVDDELRAQVADFLEAINSFLDLLLAVRNLPDGQEVRPLRLSDSSPHDRIISTLRLMTFIRGIGRSEIFIRYVQRLVAYHAALGNETEAGLTLKLHADLHEWSLTNFVDALPDLDLPRQTEFARKETLYLRILEHLGRGKAWETALDIAKELAHEYETRSFNYPRLAELLNLQAELYSSIAKSDRHFGNYFRVAFYGTRWPTSVSGKQFVYRGVGLETLGAFIDKMLNQKHPGAQLLKTSNIPPEEIQYGDSRFLQITAVTPEVDQASSLLNNPDVPHYVRVWAQHNDVNTFSFTRPLSKDSDGRSRSANDFTSLWTEKTVLICEDTFPTVLRRSEVVEIRLIEISPVENALKDVESKRHELTTLERRYRALAETESDKRKINSNPLSMALNGAVDAPINQGIPTYRQAFLKPELIATLPPAQVGVIHQLENSIDELVLTIARCLRLHGEIVAEEMQPFHETLERFFEKNFADELARLPEQTYIPTAYGTIPASSNGLEGSLPSTLPTGPRQLGSILITSSSLNSIPPSTSATSIAANHRRESVSAHAINDQSLLAGASRATRPPQVASGLAGYSNGAHGRTASLYSNVGGGASSLRGEGRAASPTRSLFSNRSTSALGHVHPSAPNGAPANGTNGNGAGRRASLFLSSAASGVKKLGAKRKGSVAQVVEES